MHLSPQDLLRYESGLVIFSAHGSRSTSEQHEDQSVRGRYGLSIHMFRPRPKSKKYTFDEIGDCFIRELDFSKLTIKVAEQVRSRRSK